MRTTQRDNKTEKSKKQEQFDYEQVWIDLQPVLKGLRDVSMEDLEKVCGEFSAIHRKPAKIKRKLYNPEVIYLKRAVMPDFHSFEEISGSLILCTVLLEDCRFAKHRGYDPIAMKLAIRNYFRRDRPLFGGSTITQQLVKNLYFTFERKVSRKIMELFLAMRFEKRLTKKQILELYLNVIYYGNGQYGIHDAAMFYFGKPPKELTLNQSFFLISILPVVGRLNPLYHPEEFVQYRNEMANCISYIADEEALHEIQRHGADCLDEEFRPAASAATDRYNAPGPMLNERFGIRGTHPLVLS